MKKGALIVIGLLGFVVWLNDWWRLSPPPGYKIVTDGKSFTFKREDSSMPSYVSITKWGATQDAWESYGIRKDMAVAMDRRWREVK